MSNVVIRKLTHIFWNADSWLPDKYDDPYLINYSLTVSLRKKSLYDHYVTAYGDEDKFTDELTDGYYESVGFSTFETTKGSERERVHMMLLDIILRASADNHHKSDFVIITKLSQDSEMICRVLGSLRQRGCRLLFTLPEVDSYSNFGITVVPSEYNLSDDCSIPVWLCPKLFDYEWPHQPEPDHGDSTSYFIQPPAPDLYAFDFSMPEEEAIDTCVFWDVEDYPLPPDLHIHQFYKNISRAVLDRVRSSFGVAFYAYAVKEDVKKEIDAQYIDIHRCQGIRIDVVRDAPADKFERLAMITRDFLLWSMDNPAKRPGPQSSPNLLVISKLLKPDTLSVRSSLHGLKNRGYNVFLALPFEEIPRPYDAKHNVPLLSWEALSATGKRKTRG